MHRAGPAAAADEGTAAAPPDAICDGLAELDWLDVLDGDDDVGAGVVAPWDWFWPQPLSSSAAAAAAVTEVITSLCFIC